MKKQDIYKILLGILGTGVLAPFAMRLGNETMNFFSTPKELKETNERITTDSIVAARQLRDSINYFRGVVGNQRERLSDAEKQIKAINTKLHIK